MSLAYIGCRTTRERNARGKGISVYRTDGQAGEWELIQIMEHENNPSWLCFGKEKKFLYAVHGDFTEVSSYRIDDSTGELTYLNTVSSGGKNPVASITDWTGEYLFVASLQGGALSTLKIREDGSLTQPVFRVPLAGMTENGFSHAHHCVLDRTGKYLFAATQGRGKGYGAVYLFRILEDGELKQLQRFDIGDDKEPRHLVVQTDNRHIYVLNEKGNSIYVLRFYEVEGKLEYQSAVSTLPADYKGESQAGEILLHPSGKYVYSTNRTHNSVAAFRVLEDGGLEMTGCISCRGDIPRFMTFDVEAKNILVANEESDTIELFHIDSEDGSLSYTGKNIKTESPVCIILK